MYKNNSSHTTSSLTLHYIICIFLFCILFCIEHINAHAAIQKKNTIVTTTDTKSTTKDTPTSANDEAIIKKEIERNRLEKYSNIKTFSNWIVVVSTNPIDNKKTCSSVSIPVQTKFLQSSDRHPYLTISYVPNKMYTISAYYDFIIDNTHPLTLLVNKRLYTMRPVGDYRAYTYSYEDDVSIMDNIIKENTSIKLWSKSVNGSRALDYYSTDGLMQSLKFMENNCSNRYNADRTTSDQKKHIKI